MALLRLSFQNDMNFSNDIMKKRMISFYKKTRKHSEKSNMHIIKKQFLFDDDVNEKSSRQELQTGTKFLNFKSSVKSMSDTVDAVKSLVQGL